MKNLKAYIIMSPALLLIILFTIVPIAGSLILMFFDYSIVGETVFIGLKNFTVAFKDRVFWSAVKNSVIFVACVPVLQFFSIVIANLVNKKIVGKAFFRVCLSLPVVTSMIAISIIWGFLFDTNGLVNSALQSLGLIREPLGFLNDKHTALLCLMFITIWQGVGYYMMIYLAGLQGIPSSIYEAAIIDGAGPMSLLFRIKLPLLKPYIWFCTLLSTISAIGVFDVVYVLTGGGPNDSTMVMNYYSYSKAFSEFQFGYAAAIGALQSVVVTLLSVAVFIYGKRGGMTGND